MTASVRIDAANVGHHRPISSLLKDAFGGTDEALLVEDLRAGGDAVVELVALDQENRVAGYVMFSNLRLECDGIEGCAVALAPLAVRLDCRNQGIGGYLVGRGLEACHKQGKVAAVVLGDPGYYGRFGFSADAAKRLHSVFQGPYLQALELVPGGLDCGQGRLFYARPFDRLTRAHP